MKELISNFNLSKLTNAEEQREQLRYIFVMGYVFFLPYERFYSSILLLLIITTTLVDFKWKKIKDVPKYFWIFQIPIILSITGYFYSFNKGDASFLIERQLAFLLFPLLLPLSIKITKKRVEYLLQTLTISCVISILWLVFYHAYFKLYLQEIPLKNIFSFAFINHNFSAPYNIHASYYSLIISLCVFYLLQLFYKVNQLSQRILIIVFLLILGVGMIFLASRTLLIYTALTALFVVPLYIPQRKDRIIYFSTYLLLLLVGLGSISTNSYLKERFTTEISEDISSASKNEERTIDEPRLERWKLGVEIIGDALFFGHGTGDEIPLLKEKYKENHLAYSYVSSFNAHNQYLSIAIKHGIIGLLIFILAFAYYFKLAVTNKSYIYLVFLIGVCSFFLTENVLDANKGIFFFAFFNSLFGYQFLMNTKEEEL